MKPVLVLDAETDQSLAVVRSLSAKKIPVHAAGRERWASALWSCRPGKRFLYPSPVEKPLQFISWIQDYLRRQSYEAVFPLTDSTLTLLQQFRPELPKIPFAMSSEESYRMVSDKIYTAKLAAKRGLDVPGSWHLQSLEELRALENSFKFPLVLKPRFSRFYDFQKQKAQIGDTQIVFDLAQLEKSFLDLRQGDFFPLIQEWVPGLGFGVEMLVQKGEARAVFCHKRIREMNPLGSGSSACESAPLRNDLVRAALALLKECGYEGVAMVEFRVDEKSGKTWFVEINGRFWGSLALPVACGVDFPYLYLKMLRGEKVEAVTDYPSGMRARSLWKESSRLISALKGRPAKWTGPFPAWGQAVKDYFGSFFRLRQIYFDFQWSDPLPAVIANTRFWLKTVSRFFNRSRKKESLIS